MQLALADCNPTLPLHSPTPGGVLILSSQPTCNFLNTTPVHSQHGHPGQFSTFPSTWGGGVRHLGSSRLGRFYIFIEEIFYTGEAG